MTHLKHLLVLATLMIPVAVELHAADFKVIANPAVSVSSVSSEDLKAVFLGTKSSLGDTHVVPVLEKSGSAHEAFLKECVGKSDAALSTYYRSLVFTGKGAMPKALGSDAEVIEYVAKTKGAIGYVGAAAAPAGVKTLDVK
jgi:ABC-type phosphate transport system substrate-binding protein